MHYYKINNEIMQYSTFGNDIALIMHYRALFTMSVYNHMDDTSHCGQKVVENAIFLAHIPVTQYSFANLLHFRRRRWAFKEGVRYSSDGSLRYPKIEFLRNGS